MSGIMTPNGILVRQGDSFNIALRFKNKDGTAMDISGATITLAVKDGSGSAVFFVDGDIVNAEEGKALIKLTPQETQTEVGKYEANIKIVFANGEVHTIFPQDLTKNAVFQISERV